MSLTLRAKRLAWRALKPFRRQRPQPPTRYQHWSIGIYTGPGPLELRPDPAAGGPVLTGPECRGTRTRYVADPFLMRQGDGWLLFFEMLNLDHGRGTIGLAHSHDGQTWQFVREILRERFHLSYPYVVEWDGERYMVPETNEAGAVRLYRATGFPEVWTYEQDLIKAPYAADATPVFYNGRWWMFVEMGQNYQFDTLRLFHADDLRGPWTEHPASPIITGDPLRARPGGRPFVHDGRLVRLAQAGRPVYGAALHAFAISELTAETYREEAIGAGPLFRGSGFGWNAIGMHHLDAHPLGDGRWIGAVDGCCWGMLPGE